MLKKESLHTPAKTTTVTSRLVPVVQWIFLIFFVYLGSAQYLKASDLSSDKSQKWVIREISFSGLNKTKPHILEVELNFKKGDTLISGEVDSLLNAQCIKLYNLQLFHWVKYNKTTQDNKIVIEFLFQERWYLWPIPIFSLADRNINAWIKHRSLDRIDYGLHIFHSNFLGRNQKLKSNLQTGYNRKYEIFYTIPYVDSSRIIGLDFAASTYNSHFIDANIDHGLPINLEITNTPALKIDYLRAGIFRRRNVNQITNANVIFESIAINDSVYEQNPDFFIRDPKKLSTAHKFLHVQLSHTINHRHTFSYPTKGYYIKLEYKGRMDLRYNLGNLQQASAEASFYTSTFKNKLVFSAGVYAKGSWLPQNNFLDTRMLGYKKYLRGFEYNIIHGNIAWMQKNNAMFNILPSKTVKFKLIPSAKFNEIPVSVYSGAHFDWGYVYAKNDRWTLSNENFYSNRMLAGGGVGIHIVTYYDRVLVLEYTFNNFGKHGFYVSTSFPI